MYKYIFKRLLMLIPVIIGVTFLVFSILKLAPGDPVRMILGGDQVSPEAIAEVRSELRLDEPYLVQYGSFMLDMVRGDFGKSYFTKRDVSVDVALRFRVTIRLSI